MIRVPPFGSLNHGRPAKHNAVGWPIAALVMLPGHLPSVGALARGDAHEAATADDPAIEGRDQSGCRSTEEEQCPRSSRCAHGRGAKRPPKLRQENAS